MDDVIADEMSERLSKFHADCQLALQKLIANQEMWADAYASGIELPYDAFRGTTYANVAQHHYVPSGEDGTSEWQLDEDETVKQFARIVKWARKNGYPIEKKYTDDEFSIDVDTENELIGRVHFYSTRQVVCKKVVTGTKVVEAVPAHEEEEVEWVCDKIAFMNVPT